MGVGRKGEDPHLMGVRYAYRTESYVPASTLAFDREHRGHWPWAHWAAAPNTCMALGLGNVGA